jgi:hypothetical protein
MDEPFKLSTEKYFEAEIKMNKSLNEILRKALGMVIIGFYDENLETKKFDVFVGINNLELWLPGYKDKVERARKILWNYYKIEKDILEMEIDVKFGKYFKIIFDSELPIGDYMDVNTSKFCFIFVLDIMKNCNFLLYFKILILIYIRRILIKILHQQNSDSIRRITI